MAFAIMRAKKLNGMGSVAASLQHCFRDRETPNADASRAADNEHHAAKSTDETMGRLRVSCCLKNGAKTLCWPLSTF